VTLTTRLRLMNTSTIVLTFTRPMCTNIMQLITRAVLVQGADWQWGGRQTRWGS